MGVMEQIIRAVEGFIHKYAELLANETISTTLGTLAAVAGIVGAAYGFYKWIREKRQARRTKKRETSDWRTNISRAIAEGRYDEAEGLAERAIAWAKEARDTKLERDARKEAAQALDSLAVATRPAPSELKSILVRYRAYIEPLPGLGERPHSVALYQAALARLESKPDEALRFALDAERTAKTPRERADALVIQLQCYSLKGDAKGALQLKSRTAATLNALGHSMQSLILRGAWLRTLCKADAIMARDVHDFLTAIKAARSRRGFLALQTVQILGEVASDLNIKGDAQNTTTLMELAYELADQVHENVQAANIALQLAELYSVAGDQQSAKRMLAHADSHIDTLRNSADDRSKRRWATVRVESLAARGRVFQRLAESASDKNPTTSSELLDQARQALVDASRFADEHEASIRGNVDAFKSVLLYWLGRVNTASGQFAEAAENFHASRARNGEAWLLEAEALMLSGQPAKALATVEELLGLSSIDRRLAERATGLQNYIRDRVQPVSSWLWDSEAQAVSNSVARSGVKQVMAEESSTLINWWEEFDANRKGKGAAYSELLDVWGRGGFARVIAAIRASPLNVITVDATSIEQIRLWSRLFCPLYDTVVVKWKGSLGGGIAIVPVHAKMLLETPRGGQGYALTSSRTDDGRWQVAVGWANMIPREVAEFLAGEAAPLVKSGRLVLLPAALVGCTQSSVGWTDSMLSDNLLGGVIAVANHGHDKRAGRDTGPSKMRDIAQISVPFIDGVSLSNLNAVLDDTTEWLRPLRKLIRESLGSPAMREERWQALSTILDDLREACRDLNDRLLEAKRSAAAGGSWKVVEATSYFSAGATSVSRIGREPSTDLMRAVVTGRPDLTPWIPYWRLQAAGGVVNWAGALDNPSREATAEEQAALHKVGRIFRLLNRGSTQGPAALACTFPE